MSYVIFSNCKDETRKIGNEVENRKQAIKEIDKFLKDNNFKSYYMRTWFNVERNQYVIDVGSHTEFFYVDKYIWEQ